MQEAKHSCCFVVNLDKKESERLAQFERWRISPAAQSILGVEQKMLLPVLEGFKPYRCLRIGPVPVIDQGHCHEVVTVSLLDGCASSVVVDAYKMPFPDEYFDLIVCAHTQESLGHLDFFMKELSRLVVPEGLIVFFALNPSFFVRTLKKSGEWNWHCRYFGYRLSNKVAAAHSLQAIYHQKSYGLCGNESVGSISKRLRQLSWYGAVSKQVYRKRVEGYIMPSLRERVTDVAQAY